MNFLCLCPTYGRHPYLIGNTVELFNRQTYPAEKRFLLILDDGNTYQPAEGENWRLLSIADRITPLPAKYNEMLQAGSKLFPQWDAVAVWEDDDVYLPDHLAEHAKQLESADYSYPDCVYSTYGGLRTEKSGGRFHASLAMSREALEIAGGWPDSKRADFDQQLIANLRQCKRGASLNPTYVFRWGDSCHKHGQAVMQGPKDESWNERFPLEFPCSKNDPFQVVPQLDASAKNIFEELEVEQCNR